MNKPNANSYSELEKTSKYGKSSRFGSIELIQLNSIRFCSIRFVSFRLTYPKNTYEYYSETLKLS